MYYAKSIGEELLPNRFICRSCTEMLPKDKLRTVQPMVSHAGRQFEAREERALYALASPAASTLPGSERGVILVSEVPGPLGQPDFIALVGGNHWLERRISSGIPPQLVQADCAVLSMLHVNRPLSESSLLRRIGWSSTDLAPVLRKLHRAGAVKITKGGAYCVIPELVPQGALFALEAKVKNWQRAMIQGRAYRSWADNYVVLLGGVGTIARQRAAEAIANDEAGLFSDHRWIVKPRARRANAAKRLWGFEYVYAAIVSSVPSFRSGE